MIAVATAPPHQRRLVLREKLGDGEPKRFAAAARIQPDVATRDEIGDALPIRRARHVNDPFVTEKGRSVFSSMTQRSDRAASAASIADLTKGTSNWLLAPCRPTTTASDGTPNSARKSPPVSADRQ